MSLKANHLSHHIGNNVGFPAVGGGAPKKPEGETKVKKKRLSAEQKAEQARLDDPYGDHGTRRNEGAGRRTRVVRRRVRRRRVGTQQTQQQYGTGKSQQAQQGKQAKAQTRSGAPTPQNSNQHMMRRMNSQSDLNRMTAQFQSGQSGRPSGPQTPVGKKMAMLGNLKNYMSDAYAQMKLNDQDTAFTYRTSEARQLVATLGTMVASTTKQGQKKDTKKSDGETRVLTAAAYGRKKGLLRELKAMSDPMGQLPEGLPPDYKPFESVA